MLKLGYAYRTKVIFISYSKCHSNFQFIYVLANVVVPVFLWLIPFELYFLYAFINWQVSTLWLNFLVLLTISAINMNVTVILWHVGSCRTISPGVGELSHVVVYWLRVLQVYVPKCDSWVTSLYIDLGSCRHVPWSWESWLIWLPSHPVRRTNFMETN